MRIALSWVDEGAPSAGTAAGGATRGGANLVAGGTLVVHLRGARLRAADRGTSTRT